MKRILPIVIFLFFTIVSYSQNIYVVKFGTLSSDQVKQLTDNGIIGKDWQTRTYELDENKKLYIDSYAITYNIIEYGIRVSSEDIKQDYDPDSKAETNKTGSNTTDYTIADLGTAYSNITISGAITGAIASRISYSWNIDHNYVSDVSVRCGTSNWNDGDQYLSKTGDDLLDGYNETSSASRTSYPSNQSVNQQWTLVAIDHYTGDAGRIDRWDLTVYYTADAPTVTTSSASGISTTSATLNGSVNPGGLTSAYWFQYGLTTSYGSSTTTRGLTAGTSATSVSEPISGLTANTTYNYRLVAQNNAGTTYGSNLTFKTSGTPPSATTNSASSITTRSAQLNGSVNPNGISTTYYFQYGTTTSYGTNTSSTSAGSGTSSVSVNATIDYLTAGTTYHYRLVATNSVGTTYGSDVSFTASSMSITMSAPSSNVTVTQGQSVTLTWSGSPSTGSVSLRRDDDNNYTNGSSGEANIAVALSYSSSYPWNTSSVPLGTYYVAAMITDGSNSKYSYAAGRVTISNPPTISYNPVSNLTGTSATLGGTINPNGAQTTAYIQYGLTTSYGTQTSSQTISAGFSPVSFSSNITGLTQGTTYHWRIVAVNSAGTTYGSDQSFTTLKKPTVTTLSASAITTRYAQLNGSVNPEGLATTYYFEYGTTASYGTNTTSASAGSGTSVVNVNSAIDYLSAGTTYHYRIVATSSSGTSYGSDMTFTTTAMSISMSSPSSNISVIQGQSVTLSWTGSPSSGVVALRQDDDNNFTNGSSGEANIAVALGYTGSYSWNTAALPLSSYYVAAYITDGSNIKYSYAAGKVTVIKLPSVVTGGYPTLSSTTATVTGTVNPNNSSTTTWVEYGTTTSYGSSTTSQSIGSGTSDISTSYSLSGLTAGVTYHYRVVAQNAAGKSYGEDKVFATFLLNITSPSSNITVVQGNNVTINWTGSPSSANVLLRRDNDNIWDNGGESSLAVLPASAGTYTWNTAGVPLGTYYIAAMITDGINSAYAYAAGKVTVILSPTVVTGDYQTVSSTTAVVTGTVNPNNSSTNTWVEYGTGTSYGSSTSAQSLGTGMSNISTSYSISGLKSGVTYHYRAVASNSAGTIYGGDKSFTTQLAPVSLNVPYYTQSDADWCWAASTSMMLGFYGVNKKLWEIAADLDKYKLETLFHSAGAITSEIISYLNNRFHLGYTDPWKSETFYSNQNLITRLKEIISTSTPVMICKLGVPFYSGAHAIVATGYTMNGIYIHDPSGYLFGGDLVHHYVSWSDFITKIDDAWFSPLGDCDIIYYSASAAESHGLATIQVNPYHVEFTNGYGLGAGNSRSLELEWDGIEPYKGYRFQTQDPWYLSDPSTGFKATSADRLTIVPTVSNYSNPIIAADFKVVLQINNSNNLPVKSISSLYFTVPGSGNNDMDNYPLALPEVMMKDLPADQYSLILKLIDLNDIIHDQLQISFSLSLSDFADFAVTNNSPIHQDITAESTGVWQFTVTNLGSKPDYLLLKATDFDRDLLFYYQGLPIDKTPLLSPNQSLNVELRVTTAGQTSVNYKEISTSFKSSNDQLLNKNISLTYSVTTLTEVQEPGFYDLKIYPNPVRDKLFLLNMPANEMIIKILDINGKILYEQKPEKEYIDIQELPTGLYFLEVGGKIMKFIKY